MSSLYACAPIVLACFVASCLTHGQATTVQARESPYEMVMRLRREAAQAGEMCGFRMRLSVATRCAALLGLCTATSMMGAAEGSQSSLRESSQGGMGRTKVTDTQTEVRVVHFPKDRSLGTVSLLSRAEGDIGLRNRGDFDYQSLGEAMGGVAVPAGKRLILHVGPDAWTNLSPLVNLRPDDLYGLSVDGWQNQPGSRYGPTKPDDRFMIYLRGLAGLRQLSLTQTNVTHVGLQHIRAMTSLNMLQIWSDRLDDRGVAQIAELKSLESLRLSGNVSDEGLAPLAKLMSLTELQLGVSTIKGPGLKYLESLPNLEHLMLEGKGLTDDSLRYLKGLTQIKSLTIFGEHKITNAGLKHLSGLTRLEELRFTWIRTFTDDGLIHLQSLHLLRKVDFHIARITDVGLGYLKPLKMLESIEGVTVTDAGLAILSQFKNLRHLHLKDAKDRPYTDDGVKNLAGLSNLENLMLGSDAITDASLDTVATLTSLTHLYLSGRQITNKGLAKLVTLKRLNTLSIRDTQVTISGLNHLSVLPNLTVLTAHDVVQDGLGLDISRLTKLEDLSLQLRVRRVGREIVHDGLHDSDLACLANLARLTRLQVSHGGISDDGLKHLAGLTNLDRLSVGGEAVTDEGLRHLANMQKLNSLTLSGSFTDGALAHLEKLKNLWLLDFMKGANFSPGALREFRRKMPRLSVYRDFEKQQSASGGQGS